MLVFAPPRGWREFLSQDMYDHMALISEFVQKNREASKQFKRVCVFRGSIDICSCFDSPTPSSSVCLLMVPSFSPLTAEPPVCGPQPSSSLVPGQPLAVDIHSGYRHVLCNCDPGTPYSDCFSCCFVFDVIPLLGFQLSLPTPSAFLCACVHLCCVRGCFSWCFALPLQWKCSSTEGCRIF